MRRRGASFEQAAREHAEGEAPIEVPNYVSPDRGRVHLTDVEGLQLSPRTLAQIMAA